MDGIQHASSVSAQGNSDLSTRQPGRWKGGEYGYPHTMVHDGYLCVIISRQKEAVEVLRVVLTELKEENTNR
jgi:hypothetical protein